jgi:hypothetical protein
VLCRFGYLAFFAFQYQLGLKLKYQRFSSRLAFVPTSFTQSVGWQNIEEAKEFPYCIHVIIWSGLFAQ